MKDHNSFDCMPHRRIVGTSWGVSVGVLLLFYLWPALCGAAEVCPNGLAGHTDSIPSNSDSPPPPVVVDSFMLKSGPEHPVYTFTPKGISDSVPVILFCHGLGATDPLVYRRFILHMVRGGYAVLYAPYSAPKATVRPMDVYDDMIRGFDSSLVRLAHKVDTTRIGFVGHSWGGGAVPHIAHRYLNRRGFGTRGTMLYIMAPWYSYGMSDSQLVEFPDHAAMVMEVFEDDRINDHRMAADIYDHIGISPMRKHYIAVRSEDRDGVTLTADHSVPADDSASGAVLNALDSLAVHRVFDLLAARTLSLDRSKMVADLCAELRSGDSVNPSGESTCSRLMSCGHTAILPRPQSAYVNFWNHALNPRAQYTTYFNAPKHPRYNSRVTRRNYFNILSHYRFDLSESDSPARQSTGSLHVTPPDSGYGSPGPYRIKQRSFPHPDMGDGYIHIFSPDSSTPSPRPVILLLHGFSWDTPEHYRGLIHHLVSRGNTVLFPSWKTRSVRLRSRMRYDLALKGFKAALELLTEDIDTSRIGIFGHSFGGGMVPALAHYFLSERRWGGVGAFLYLSAPWYVHHVTNTQLDEIPPNTRVVIQVFDDESFTDWRIAEDVFYSIGVPRENKEFVIVHSDDLHSPPIRAEHVATLSGERHSIDAVDYFALYRVLDALADCAFTGSEQGCAVALGEGEDRKVSMGIWPDGIPVTELKATDSPMTPYPQRSFLFRWNGVLNTRRKQYTPRDELNEAK